MILKRVTILICIPIDSLLDISNCLMHNLFQGIMVRDVGKIYQGPYEESARAIARI